MGIALIILMYGVWSSMFSLAKIALQYTPPVFLTGFRMVIAGVLLLGFIAFTNRSSFKLNRKQLLSLGCLGFFGIYLTNILEFWALQYLSAAKTCFIYSLSPFFAVFFSYLHFNEKMNLKKWIGLALGFFGMIPVLSLQTGSEELLNIYGFFSWPTLAVMGAALASVYGGVLPRLIVKDQMISPTMANGTSAFFGGALALIHSFFVDSWNPTPIDSSHAVPFLGWTLLIVFISNIVCYNLYGMMLKKFTATFLSFFGLLSPFFASLHGWIFLNESPSWIIFLSTGIVSLGLWIIYASELKQGYILKKSQLTA